jgi:DNA helicase-2/ATP-dependent DNA helicase PcrA
MHLNPQQREAIEHGEGPLLIIAGAGTGKTLVLTHRIAHLIKTKRCRPEEILALTFTEKAALEMEERVDLLVPYGYVDVWISTFHAFGDRILREYSLRLGLTPNFRVLTRPEEVLFLRKHLFKLPLGRFRPLGNPTKHLQALLDVFSRAKDEDITPEEYLAFLEKLRAEPQTGPEAAELAEEIGQHEEVARTYRQYQKLLLEAGAINFGDQVALTLKLFREHPEVLAEIQRRFRYILVDEFQDTNFAQYQLVKLLSRPHKNLTVVGDDDQSIYRFRGAAMSNILMFRRDFPEAGLTVLTENHRSTQAILDAAYRLIRHNDPERLEVKARIVKRLRAAQKESEEAPVRHLHYDTLSAEADGVARLIHTWRSEGRRSYRDAAILVRSNDDAEPFLRALNLLGIPWHFSGSRGLYRQEEIRLLIAFLRVLADPHHSPSLHYLAGSPLYRVPVSDLTQCARLCRRQHVSLYSVFGRLDRDLASLEMTPEGRATITKLMQDLHTYEELSRNRPVGIILYEFIKRSGWLSNLTETQNARAEAVLRNIARFFDLARRFETLTDHPYLQPFVEHLDLLIEAGDDPPTAQADPDMDAVSVLTLHKAKGLEFPAVFLVGLIEQRFPARNRRDAIELPAALLKDEIPPGDIHLEEERRLFYVGMTRAMKELYLTSARDYGSERERKVSRFVAEALGMTGKEFGPVRATAREAIERHGPPAPLAEPTLVLTSPEEPLQLSYYRIDDYTTCPLKYKYNHILQMPIYQHHAVMYGAALHQAVAAYLRARVQKIPFGVSDLLKVFESEWRSEGFISREHEEQRFAVGRELLKRFYEREEASGAPPAAVEQPFKFTLGRDVITGRWDRVDRRDGRVIIVDYKSSDVADPKKADREAKESLQLTLYAMAYRAKTGRLPDEVQLHFLESGLVGRAQKTEKDLEKLEALIQKTAAGIRAQDFTARPAYLACSYCAYRDICPHTAARGEP